MAARRVKSFKPAARRVRQVVRPFAVAERQGDTGLSSDTAVCVQLMLTGIAIAVRSRRPQAQASVPTAREASQCFRIFVMAVPEWAG